MITRLAIVLVAILSISQNLLGQSGGEGAYDFLNLTLTPRSAALGGKVVALDESDPGVMLNNPGHLNQDHNNLLSLSYIGYFADIRYGFVSYSRHFEKIGTFGIGIQHVDYGSFIEADVLGNITGSFTGYDMSFNLLYSRTFDSLITVGINLKPIYSHLETYQSWGIAGDIGVSITNQEKLFSAGVAARNIGRMIKPYTTDTWEPLPFELIAGFSQKLRHAPFRFIATFHQLQNTNLYYERQREQGFLINDDSNQTTSLLEKIGKEFVSHLILGVEFVPIRNFYVRGGYNYQRRNELKIEERVSTVGFSWGIGIKVNRFNISYSRASYHLVGGSNHFSISTNLDDFISKKII